MNIWANIGSVAAAISGILALASAVYGIYIKCSKKYKAKKAKKLQRDIVIDNISKNFETIDDKIDEIVQHHEDLANDVAELKNSNDQLNKLLDQMDTTVLRNLIWTTVGGCEDFSDIPDRQLRMALEGCDIYLGKGENHETARICAELRNEQDRRLGARGGSNGK